MQGFDGEVTLRVVVIQVELKLVVRDLVALLKLAIVLVFVLDGVVGEVNEEIGEVPKIKQLGARANIALAVPKELGDASDGKHQHIGADVELPLLVKH